MFPASQQVTSVPYAEYAQLLGLQGTVVNSPEHVVPAWEAALSADRPFLIHAWSIPPFLSFRRAWSPR